jgi:phosphoglycolate phosphatase
MVSSQHVRAIVFDYDDTLVQTKRTKYQAIQALGERYYSLAITPAMIDAHWGSPHTEFYAQLFKGVETNLTTLLDRRYLLSTEFPNLAYEDAKPVLEYLIRKYPVGIVTASGREMLESELPYLDLPTQQLVFVQTSEDTPYYKPDPRVFDLTKAQLHSLGVGPTEILYVGDSLKDLHAARGAQFQFVGIAHNTTSPSEFEAEGANWVTTLNALTEWL